MLIVLGTAALSDVRRHEANGQAVWLPGRWIGGMSLIVGPELLLVGVCFFFLGEAG